MVASPGPASRMWLRGFEIQHPRWMKKGPRRRWMTKRPLLNVSRGGKRSIPGIDIDRVYYYLVSRLIETAILIRVNRGPCVTISVCKKVVVEVARSSRTIPLEKDFETFVHRFKGYHMGPVVTTRDKKNRKTFCDKRFTRSNPTFIYSSV